MVLGGWALNRTWKVSTHGEKIGEQSGLGVSMLALPEALLCRWKDPTAWLRCYHWASQAIPSAPWKDHGLFPPPQIPCGPGDPGAPQVTPLTPIDGR